MRQGQISTFIILGILIFAVIGFLYIAVHTSQKSTSAQKQKVDTAILSEVALSNFISSCVEQSAKDAIEHIGFQGGRIFPTEVNSILFGQHPFLSANLPIHGKISQVNVSYDSLALIPALLPPQYPCGNQVPYATNQYTYCGFVNDKNKFSSLDLIKFGLPNILPLCKSKKECNFEEVSVGEKTLSLAGPFSIQEQLEESIKKKLYDCVDIEKLDGYNAKFTAQKVPPDVSLSFEDKAVRIAVLFPINISLLGKEPSIILASFHTDIPLRLKSMYKFMRYAIEKDNTDLSYNIKNDVQNPYAKPGFTTEFISAGENSIGGDYIVRVSDTDPHYSLYGQPFIFEYAVKNRPPVLEYIPLSDLNNEGVFNPSLSHEFEVTEGDDIKMYISAIDPDDTQNIKDASGQNWPKISFSGWKEDDPIPSENVWSNSFTGKIIPYTTSYKTTILDEGDHVVKVSAFDGVFTDYQDVRIDVKKIIDVSIQKYFNSLSGEEENVPSSGKVMVSLEDKVLFYPSATADSSNDFIYSWILDDKEVQSDNIPKEYIVQNDIKKNDPTKSPFNGKNDKKLVFSVKNKLPSLNNVEDGVTLDVQRCISNKNSKVYPYPYNRLTLNNHDGSDDPFIADRPCCDKGNYQNANAPCFSYVRYGCYDMLKKKYLDVNGEVKKIFNYAGKSFNPNSFTDISFDKTNDVYKMEISDKCTGNRGNICLGNPIGSISISTMNLDLGIDETERCSLGCNPVDVYENENDAKIPSSESFETKNENTFANSHVITTKNVPLTYEKFLNLKDKNSKDPTGICNKNLRKSNSFGNSGFILLSSSSFSIPYMCQSTCGNKGCNFAINCVCGDPIKDQTTGDSGCTGIKEADIFESKDKKVKNSKMNIMCDINCKITS